MFTCADCSKVTCRKKGYPEEKEELPANCPLRTHKELLDEANKTYFEEDLEFFRQSTHLEAEAFGRYPRLKETIVFCRKMKYRSVGVAFCNALDEEARIVCKLLRQAGLEVEAVRCKCGGTVKSHFGVPRENWVNDVEFEAACNPIGQAFLLNEQKVEFNIVIGLCVGHDSLFLSHAQAPCTVLIVKDRVLGHNPVNAVYLHKKPYWGSLTGEGEQP